VPECFFRDYADAPDQPRIDADGAAFAVARNEAFAQAVFAAAVAGNTAPGLKYETGAQAAARFRAAYKSGTGMYAGQLATWLLARITDATFTDAQVRNAFGLTTTQYNAMKTRMQSVASNYAALLAAAGE
jgi:hypothetical protein